MSIRIRLAPVLGALSGILVLARPVAAEEPKAPPPSANTAQPPQASKTAPPAAAPQVDAARPVVVSPGAKPGSAVAAKPTSSIARPSRPKEKVKEPEPEPLAPHDVRLWVIAPSPSEPWTLRVDNEGSRPVRIPADVQLLELEIDVPVLDGAADATIAAGAKNKSENKGKIALAKKAKPVLCAAPNTMRSSSFPENRALLLAPGESYIETFDPRLLCFGKSASALTGGAVVRSRFGWAPPKTPKWAPKSQKPPTGPFAVEGTDYPAVFASLSQLSAPTLVLSYGPSRAREGKEASDTAAAPPANPTGNAANTGGAQATQTAQPVKSEAGGAKEEAAAAKGDAASPISGAPGQMAAKKEPDAQLTAPDGQKPSSAQDAAGARPESPPKIVDANAPRLEIKAPAFADAVAPRNVTLTTTVKNAGHRPMLAVLRSRMIGFHVEGPDGERSCNAAPPSNSVPRDMFRTYKPDAVTSFTILLVEVCPRDAFARSGLYSVTPELHAEESGSAIGLNAFTDVVEAPSATLVRVQTGPEPYYTVPPIAVPTPRPAPASE